VQVLIGLGAWLAAIFCMISFLLVFGEGISAGSVIFSGLVFCGVSLAIKYGGSRSVFWGQLALVMSIMGQVLFIAGVAESTENEIATLWATIILEAVLLAIYPGLVQRFLSAALIMAAVQWLILIGNLSWALHLLATVLAILTVVVWVRAPFLGESDTGRDIYLPLSYALPLGMFGALLLPLLELDLHWDSDLDFYVTSAYFDKPLIAAIGLFIIAIWLIREILARYHLSGLGTLERFLYGAVFLITIASLQTPGILAALLVLTIGFWRNDKVLMGLAVGFLAVFIGVFYYNLQTTLLVKSYIMLTTGTLLLVLWYVVFRRGEMIKEK
jgi:hypothetical protein